ncbi:hypothetical protein DFH06DRAFT_1146368 [Mycena polygramma]|nr:hypothetical protein DFH06DRAFT_1146368 [Mycena polygramma]
MDDQVAEEGTSNRPEYLRHHRSHHGQFAGKVRGYDSAKQVRSKCEASAKQVRSKCEASAKQVRSKCEASAKQVRSKCEASAKQVRSKCEAVRSKCEASAKQVRSKCEASAKQVRSKCEASAKQVRSKCEASAKQVRSKCEASAKQVRSKCEASAKQGHMCKIWHSWSANTTYKYGDSKASQYPATASLVDQSICQMIRQCTGRYSGGGKYNPNLACEERMAANPGFGSRSSSSRESLTSQKIWITLSGGCSIRAPSRSFGKERRVEAPQHGRQWPCLSGMSAGRRGMAANDKKLAGYLRRVHSPHCCLRYLPMMRLAREHKWWYTEAWTAFAFPNRTFPQITGAHIAGLHIRIFSANELRTAAVAIERLTPRIHNVPMFAGHNINEELLAVALESGLRYVEEGEGTAAAPAGFATVGEAYSGFADCVGRQAEEVGEFLGVLGGGRDARGALKALGHLGLELLLGDNFVRVNASRMRVRRQVQDWLRGSRSWRRGFLAFYKYSGGSLSTPKSGRATNNSRVRNRTPIQGYPMSGTYFNPWIAMGMLQRPPGNCILLDRVDGGCGSLVQRSSARIWSTQQGRLLPTHPVLASRTGASFTPEGTSGTTDKVGKCGETNLGTAQINIKHIFAIQIVWNLNRAASEELEFEHRRPLSFVPPANVPPWSAA